MTITAEMNIPATARLGLVSRGASQAGQAMTETIMLTWLLLLFFAATYQVFLVNETVYRSMTAVHQRLFARAFPSNCYDDGDEKCKYNTDATANVIWRKQDFPELQVRTVKLFAKWGMPGNLLVHSNVWEAEPAKGCDVPCKHTKMAVGTYWPIMGCAFWYNCLD
jgi:hypothetical protein